MSIYPRANGIRILNQDILSYIFTLNADMFTDRGALRTTCITSHVCQTWRNLMLATPSLWARLIDMECFSEARCMKAIEEFIRRSGATLLWIKVRRPGLSEDIAEFLLRIMEKNWHRIQKLVVFKQCTNFNDNLFQLAYKSPVPYLETFHLAFAVYDDGVDTPGAPFTTLFGDMRPCFDNSALMVILFISENRGSTHFIP